MNVDENRKPKQFYVVCNSKGLTYFSRVTTSRSHAESGTLPGDEIWRCYIRGDQEPSVLVSFRDVKTGKWTKLYRKERKLCLKTTCLESTEGAEVRESETNPINPALCAECGQYLRECNE